MFLFSQKAATIDLLFWKKVKLGSNKKKKYSQTFKCFKVHFQNNVLFFWPWVAPFSKKREHLKTETTALQYWRFQSVKIICPCFLFCILFFVFVAGSYWTIFICFCNKRLFLDSWVLGVLLTQDVTFGQSHKGGYCNDLTSIQMYWSVKNQHHVSVFTNNCH